jgi:hypothetical protein
MAIKIQAASNSFEVFITSIHAPEQGLKNLFNNQRKSEENLEFKGPLFFRNGAIFTNRLLPNLGESEGILPNRITQAGTG